MTTIKNKVLTNIKTLMDLQNEKGLKKYGQSLDDCPSNKHDWKIMIIEELIDALQYQQKEMLKMKEQERKRIDVLTDLIEDWAVERNLHVADYHKQFLKLSEEVGELAQALAKNKSMDNLKEEIGGIYVVLTILSMQLGLDVRDCINYEYDKIINRKGKMINGVFVKEEDLPARAEVSN